MSGFLRWLGLLQCVIGVAAIVLPLRYIFGYVWRKHSYVLWAALCLAAAAEVIVLILWRTEQETADYLQEALNLVCAAAAPYLLLHPHRNRTFLLFGLSYCATVDFFALLVPVRHSVIVSVLTDAAVCLLSLVLNQLNRKAPPDFLEQVPVLIYITVFAADLSAYYNSMLSHDASYYFGVSTSLKAFSFGLIVGSAVWLVRRYLTLQRAEQVASEQLARQLSHYDDLVDKNLRIRALRHDYENNLFSIGAILDAGQVQHARDYVRELQGEVHAASVSAATGNYFADAILFEKASAAAKQNVQISISGTVPQKGIANVDLCTILCNLLDNAICGSSPCAPCVVEIVGQEASDRWLFTVKNPVAQKVIIRGGMIPTSKKDFEKHGLGLANVRRAVEKYNGYLELNCDDHCFTAEVGLMLNTEVKK